MTNSRPIDDISNFFTQHRLAVLATVMAVMFIFLYGMTRVQGDIILTDMFPKGHPYLEIHEKFSKIFGSGASTVVICVKSKTGDIFNKPFLSNLRKMAKEIVFWDETYRLLTYSIASKSAKVVRTKAKGEIEMCPLIGTKLPETEEEMKELKKSIFSSEDYAGRMVSLDGASTLVFTEFKEEISYERVHEMLRTLAEKYQDENTEIYIVGFPALAGWIQQTKYNTRIIFGISGIVLLITLVLMSRNLAVVVAPLVIGFVSTVFGVGLAGLLKINLSPLLYVTAFLVGARMVSHSLQVANRYLEELYDTKGNRRKACYETMRTMIVPNLAGVVTDSAGFLVLIIVSIPLLQQIALIMSFWMMSIGFAAVLTPIICSFLPVSNANASWDKSRTKLGILDRIIMATSRFSFGRGRWFLCATVIALFAVSLFEMSNLKIGDPTPGSPLFYPDHPYNQDQRYIDNNFQASSENFMLFFEGKTKFSVYDPAVLNVFEAFDRHMKRRLPDIYKSSSSIISIGKNVNMTYHDGDPAWKQLPRNDRMLSFLIGIIRLNAGQGVLNLFIDSDLKRARINIYFKDHTSDNLKRIRTAAYEFFETHPMEIEKGKFILAGGRVGLEMAVNAEMAKSHARVDILVLFTIFVLCSISFRSFIAGLMLTLPLIFANMLAYAYMSVNNIGLSINTLPVSAIGVGVGVDFAIYLYSRIIEEYPGQKDLAGAIMMAVRTSGKTVFLTGLAMILVLVPWFLWGELKFQAQMGFFLSMLLGANVIIALTVHPLLVYIIKPKFITSKRKERETIIESAHVA